MKIIRPRNIDSLNDNDMLYVSRSLINATVAHIVSNGMVTNKNMVLVQRMSEAVEQEYETKSIIPYIPMSVKEVKECFPNYVNLARGDFFKW